MRIINSRVHGILDYLVSLIVISAPWIFGFARNGAETWVPVVLGITSIIYSLLTRYEFGAVRVLSFKTHLMLDTASAIILTLSPWVFGFHYFVFVPHVVLGVAEMVAVLMTDPSPFKKTSSSMAEHQVP